MIKVQGVLLLSAAAGAMVTASAAFAADGNAGANEPLQDIVVTAEKRTVSIDKVPLAVSAVSGEELARQGVASLQSVAALIPNFNFGESFGAAKLSVRGISYSNLSTGAEGSVAYNLNDVYIARPAGQLGNFFDIERVEVLRGPQGTLYGRNATGGAFNLYSARPTWNTDGFVQLTVGNYDERTIEGAISGALVPGKVAARLAVYATDRDGYGTNLVTGRDVDANKSIAGRLSLLLEPASNLSVLVVGDYGREKDRSRTPHLIAEGGLTGEPGTSGTHVTGVQFGGTVLLNSYDVYADIDPDYRRTTGGVLVDAKLDLGSLTLRSLSAWRTTRFHLTADLDASSVPFARIYYHELSDQYSQEFNLSYTSDRLDAIGGIYYFKETLFGSYQTPRLFPGATGYVQNFFAGGDLETNAAAIFGQINFKATDKLTVVLGARYSTEKKEEGDLYTDFANFTRHLQPFDPDNPPVGPAFRQSKRWNSFTPKFGLNYQADPDTLFFASVSQGFKAGVFNLGGAAAVPGNPSLVSNPAVNPEKVWAYELGVKTRQLDRRMRLALTGFYYDYSDLQLQKVEGSLTLLTNAAKARIYGLEAEMDLRVSDRLALGLNGTWLHARFTDFSTLDPARRPLGVLDLSGNTLPQAPDFTATGKFDYKIPLNDGDITVHGDVFWTSRIYYSEFNRIPVSQGAYAKVNASVAWSNESLGVSVFVRNLFDVKTVDTSYQSSVTLGYPIYGWLAPPRTYGVRLTKWF